MVTYGVRIPPPYMPTRVRGPLKGGGPVPGGNIIPGVPGGISDEFAYAQLFAAFAGGEGAPVAGLGVAEWGGVTV